MKQYPSIFNDVIGPVMIGNSSSHTAASVRIGNLIRQLAGADIAEVHLKYDSNSSLASAHVSQFVDSAIMAGILGFATSDPQVCHGLELADAAGIKYSFTVLDIEPGHPNTYYIFLTLADGRQMTMKALSIGGGMVQVIEYQGFSLLIEGGFHEVLVPCLSQDRENLYNELCSSIPGDSDVRYLKNGEACLMQIRSEEPPDDRIKLLLPGEAVILTPGLPVKSQLDPDVPFLTGQEIISYCEKHNNLSLGEVAALYESSRSGETVEQVYQRMGEIINILRQSLHQPPDAFFTDRILPNQAHLSQASSHILGGRHHQFILEHVTRFMDIKASLGVIVAAPTAGACSCLPGVVFALGEELSLDDNQLVEAMLAAGLIGVLIAAHSTFAAELAGCQAECGAASGMAAAACAQILGLSPQLCLAAASMALQNVFGLTCDPVAMRVEVPCLGKNIMAAFNAVACANMAAAGYAQVIPIDETIAAFDAAGRALPVELRCTGLAGLSITPTARDITARLAGR